MPIKIVRCGFRVRVRLLMIRNNSVHPRKRHHINLQTKRLFMSPDSMINLDCMKETQEVQGRTVNPQRRRTEH